MKERVFGHIDGVPVGAWFESRQALAASGVHRPTQAGISGSEKEGADSIVLSGGYEDDEDYGDVIVYTGHGGRNPATGEQVSDQVLRNQNLALARNRATGLPVRVVRGARHDSPDSPPAGYRYDGLYYVEDVWRDTGRSGFAIWRFRLVAAERAPQGARRVAEEGATYAGAPRVESTVVRIVRDTEQARAVKKLYDYRCQVCGIRLEGAAGPYAEAAHIRPLGAPHNGPDALSNLLCLCPNHHVLFDDGAFTISDEMGLIGTEGELHVHPMHEIDPVHLRYHREHYFRAI